MSRPRSYPARAKAAFALLLVVAAGAACDDDGLSAPSRCLDPPLPLFDVANAGAPGDDNARFNDGTKPSDPPPCVTEVGHSVSYVGVAGTATTTAGTSSSGAGGKANTAGTQNAPQGGADAGAGGA